MQVGTFDWRKFFALNGQGRGSVKLKSKHVGELGFDKKKSTLYQTLVAGEQEYEISIDDQLVHQVEIENHLHTSHRFYNSNYSENLPLTQ
ncbi:MAG: hypothetical protein HQK50_06205 [Oligoflexia bacterium]|nr:hypothetical protein [Oligoflexia bacterium]